MPIRGGGKERKSQPEAAHPKPKGPKAIKARQKKRQERKTGSAG